MRRIVAVLAFLAPTAAFAHAALTEPDPRSTCDGAANCKTAPCGTIVAGAVTKTFNVGSSYTLSWNETVEHVSAYRLALSTNGETAFNTQVIMPYGTVPDVTGPATFDWIWTVPDTTACNPSCVMQLIQDMNLADGDTPATNYYNCADIQILPAGSVPTPTPTPTATPTPGNPNGPVEVDGYGSCSVGANAATGAGLLSTLLVAAALVSRRFRR